MKVIAINGSPRKNGNTALSLNTVGEELKKEGVEFEIINIGHKAIHGCIACGKCGERKNEKCVFDDVVNEVFPKLKEADGILIGSPVYYAGIAGTMKCFLDRSFYVAGANGRLFRGKVGASVAVARRTGGSMTFNSLNQYLNIGEMLVASSNYWNVAHGRTEGEAALDAEGMQVMRILGKNMAMLLKMREAVPMYEVEAKIATPFVREDLKL